MSIAIIVLETLAIPYTYPAPVNQGYYGGEWGSPQVTVHLEVPEGLDPQCIMAVKDEEGTITLQADPVKLQAKTAQAWSTLRTERNARLAASDYTQLQDAHLSQDKKDAWAAYRQALRDLPDETTNPLEAAWPLKPGELPPVVPVASSRFGALLEEAGVEPVVEVPEVQVSEPVVEPVVEVPEVPEVVEPVVEVPEVPDVPEPVVEFPEVQASEPAPVEAEPVV